MNFVGKLPDDPVYEHINPYLKIWLYEGWLHDRELEIEKMRQFGIFVGSFSNPEMAQRLIKAENPDHDTTDLDQTSKKVRQSIIDSMKKNRKKRKNKITNIKRG